MRKRTLALLLSIVAECVSALPAAELVGKVSDRSGAQIAAAGVSLQKGFLDVQSVTNESGAFRFADLEPGDYQLQVSRPGFDTLRQPVTIPDSGTPALTLTLQIAGLVSPESGASSGGFIRW